MSINFQCECGKPFWTADVNAGRRMLCTRCGREIGVPQVREEGIVFIEPARPSLAAIAGMALRVISRVSLVEWLVCLAILGVLVGLMLPAVATNCGGVSRRSRCINNLKEIGLAFHNYHSEHGHFPANITDARGKPLLSWRVTILPYIEQEELYGQFKLDEPWDSPNNWPLIAKMPGVYSCQSDLKSIGVKTGYQALLGPGSLYDGDKPPSIDDVIDGTSRTFCVVETLNVVAWTKPDDADIRWINTELGSKHPMGFNVLMADGSAKWIRETTPPAILKALSTKAGGEKLYEPY